MTRDMDREHTLSVRLDWFADCGYWSSWHSILHHGSCFTMHDDVTDPIARKVARQLGSVGDAIAPPGTARRGALVLAGRGLKALPRLSSRRYVAHKIKTTLIRARGSLFLILRPYQIINGRLVRGSALDKDCSRVPLFSPFTIGWMSRSSSPSSTTAAIRGTVSYRSRN